MEPKITVDGYLGGPTEMDRQAESFITDLAKEYKHDDIDSELAPVETKGQSDTPADPVLDKASEAPKVDAAVAPPAAKSPEDRGIERVVEREVALRAREDALAAREASAASLEAKVKALETRQVPDDLYNRFETEPEEALKALGLDPENVVRMVIAKRLGDKAEPQVRQVIEQAKIKKELHDLRAQLHEQHRATQAQAFVAKVESEARAYVNRGIGEHAPIVATVAKANPDRVYREIMEEISKDASEKMARGSGGDVLSYDEASKRVETRWSEFKSILSPTSAPATPAPASTPAPSETVSEAKPSTPSQSQTKIPDRPIAPWLQRSVSEDEGIKAGIGEYKRLEGRS